MHIYVHVYMHTEIELRKLIISDPLKSKQQLLGTFTYKCMCTNVEFRRITCISPICDNFPSSHTCLSINSFTPIYVTYIFVCIPIYISKYLSIYMHDMYLQTISYNLNHFPTYSCQNFF